MTSLSNRQDESGQLAKRFYAAHEVATLLGVSTPTIYREIRPGRFPAIRVRGRMDRQACHAEKQIALNLPQALRDRIEALQDGGGINGAMVGLIHFALDELERRRQTLRVDLGGG